VTRRHAFELVGVHQDRLSGNPISVGEHRGDDDMELEATN
jgi:hypothetical protein